MKTIAYIFWVSIILAVVFNVTGVYIEFGFSKELFYSLFWSCVPFPFIFGFLWLVLTDEEKK